MLTEVVTPSPPSHGPTEAATMVVMVGDGGWQLKRALEEERGLYYGVADGTNLLSIVVSRVLLSSSVVARTPRRFKSDADYVPPPWMSVSSWTDT